MPASSTPTLFTSGYEGRVQQDVIRLLCFEFSPRECHRRVIAEELALDGIVIEHL